MSLSQQRQEYGWPRQEQSKDETSTPGGKQLSPETNTTIEAILLKMAAFYFILESKSRNIYILCSTCLNCLSLHVTEWYRLNNLLYVQL